MIALICILALATAYGIGVGRAWHRAGTGRGVTHSNVGCFAAAIVVLATALGPPLDELADGSFAVHMTQHLLLAAVVPPFLVLGAPELALLWSLPRPIRRWLPGRALRGSPLQATWNAITYPVAAWSLHLAAIWLWHAPRLFDLALRHEALHVVEHACFLGTGVLLWWRIIHVVPHSGARHLRSELAGSGHARRRAACGIGIVTLFATAMQTGVLGALLTFSHRVLYPVQSAALAHTAGGLTALEDQQLAGLIMWVVGGLLYTIAMSALFVVWLEPRSRRAVRAIVAASAVGAAGCTRAQATQVPGGDAARGKQAIATIGCGACHVIGGIPGAQGEVGPPLDGIARRAIVGGALANTPDNMVLWIEDPPAIEPNTAMPNLGISQQTARDIAAYLYTLK